MSKKEEEIVLDRICQSNVQVVNITGGEPMLDTSRCIEIIRKLCGSGKDVYLSTNGYAFDYWKREIGNLALLGLPLDGYDEKSNTVNGRDQHSFSRVMEILNSQEVSGTNVKIGTVITRNSIDRVRLIKISELLDKLPVQLWRIYEVIPENSGEINKKALLLSETERYVLQDAVQEICKAEHHYRIELVTRNMRSSAYFIIQPNGMVMTPIDNGEVVEEIEIGSLIDHSLYMLEAKWLKVIEAQNVSDYAKERYYDVKGVYK